MQARELTPPAVAAAAAADPGGYLRRAREARRLPLEDVAQKTKIKIEFLRWLEEGALERLPAAVFVRGFARAYAQVVGASQDEATARLQKWYAARDLALAGPEVVELVAPYELEQAEAGEGRRRYGVVLVVLVILLAATLTLSLLLRRSSPTAGGISERAVAADLERAGA
jgi:cytoskeletal protein RodZ